MSEIPIVSLEKLTHKLGAPNRDDWVSTATAFGNALRSTGFVYLADHGIPEDKIQRVFNQSVNFFKLPLKEKQVFERDFESTFHGYTQVGGELMTLDASLELREMFDAAISSVGRDSNNCPYPVTQVPDFKPAMEALMKECSIVTKMLLKVLAIALGLENEDFFLDCHKNIDDSAIPNYTQLRTLFYPSVPEDITAGSVRCAAHSDYGTVTLLFQDSMGGLEVKSVDGGWIPANPISGTILINVGDLLHIWSGGMFPSTVHRVIIPDEVKRKNSPRQSVALFVKPDNSTLVCPLKGEEKDKEVLIEKVYAGEHFRKRTVYHHHMAVAKTIR